MGGTGTPGAARRARADHTTRFHRRVAAETLLARAAGGPARLAPALAHAALDLNPHQIEAAAFALSALPAGGAVLADEVGLGKTIEAGLVLAQLASEGKGRALVLAPASIRAQWREELRSRFGLEASVVDGETARAALRGNPGANPFDVGGIAIASHAFAARHAAALERVPFDLAVIDEAHRLRNAHRADHRTGQALRRALARCPKLLLTATPLQNDLAELLGLASFVDEALLGSEEAFRLRYGAGELDEEKAADLRARLAPVVVRTLRRQVKEYVKFTARRSLVEDFAPTPEEQALYDRVSEYLRREEAAAIPPSRRALAVLVYRKILASSSFALAATLDRLAASLRERLSGPGAAGEPELELEAFAEEADELGPDVAGSAGEDPSPRAAREELRELEACARMARSIRSNAKARALVRGLDRAFTVAKACGWPEKAVVFTEFRRTQEHLRAVLASTGYSVTCLSGDVPGADRRQALVEEFRARTQVLLMTEAGAEGLNLQFCNLVVNYDLPWNPQRIEQRIGRCHRYGQTRDVLVLNFLNRANAADARLYELLSRKLALFDGVFGSSDEVLGALGSGVDFERRVLDIYQSCRSAEEVDEAFASLQGDLEGRIGARLSAARALLLERFDAEVRARLRLTATQAREVVERRREEEDALVAAAFPGGGAGPAGTGEAGPGRSRLVRSAAETLRARPPEPVSFLGLRSRHLPASLARLAGREGWWFAHRLSFEGLTAEERVAHLVLWSDGVGFHLLAPEEAAAFASLPAEESRAGPGGSTPPVGAAHEEALAAIQARFAAEARERSEVALDVLRERWDRWAEDALAAPRAAAEEARAAWTRARGALVQPGPLPPGDRRALLERAERAFRRKLEDLRVEEARRWAERDRAVGDLRRGADPRDGRALVATAYWRCH
jgi:superfamily II DNA or RNA helicase